MGDHEGCEQDQPGDTEDADEDASVGAHVRGRGCDGDIGAHGGHFAHIEVDPLGHCADVARIGDPYEGDRVVLVGVQGGVGVDAGFGGSGDDLAQRVHGDEDDGVRVGAGGLQVCADRPLLPEERDLAVRILAHGGTDRDGPRRGRCPLALGNPRGDNEVSRRVVTDDPQGRPVRLRVRDSELDGDGRNVLVGVHARQGRARLVALGGGAEHAQLPLVDLIQAGRRVDDEVGTKPALGQAQLRAHAVERHEANKHARRLGERENQDDRGTHRVRPDVLDGNEAQREVTRHC